jgi:hypothetical protein
VHELRCPNGIKFANLDENFIEVVCRSQRCGKRPGVIVIHRFSHEGELLRTMKFRDPAVREEETR